MQGAPNFSTAFLFNTKSMFRKDVKKKIQMYLASANLRTKQHKEWSYLILILFYFFSILFKRIF